MFSANQNVPYLIQGASLNSPLTSEIKVKPPELPLFLPESQPNAILNQNIKKAGLDFSQFKNADFLEYFFAPISDIGKLCQLRKFKKLILEGITDEERTLLTHALACAIYYKDSWTVEFCISQGMQTTAEIKSVPLSTNSSLPLSRWMINQAGREIDFYPQQMREQLDFIKVQEVKDEKGGITVCFSIETYLTAAMTTNNATWHATTREMLSKLKDARWWDFTELLIATNREIALTIERAQHCVTLIRDLRELHPKIIAPELRGYFMARCAIRKKLGGDFNQKALIQYLSTVNIPLAMELSRDITAEKQAARIRGFEQPGPSLAGPALVGFHEQGTNSSDLIRDFSYSLLHLTPLDQIIKSDKFKQLESICNEKKCQREFKAVKGFCSTGAIDNIYICLFHLEQALIKQQTSVEFKQSKAHPEKPNIYQILFYCKSQDDLNRLLKSIRPSDLEISDRIPQSSDNSSYTPLEFAAYYEILPALHYLIKKGVSIPTAVTKPSQYWYETTVLGYAIMKDNTDILMILLKEIQHLKEVRKKPAVFTKILVDSLVFAIERGSFRTVEFLLKTYPQIINGVDDDLSPLLKAIRGRQDLLAYLLNQNPKLVTHKPASQPIYELLHHWYGSDFTTKAIQKLRDDKVDLMQIKHREYRVESSIGECNNLLMAMIDHKYNRNNLENVQHRIHILKLLLQDDGKEIKANDQHSQHMRKWLSEVGQEGHTLFHLAVAHNDITLLPYLCELYQRYAITDVLNYQKQTVMMLAFDAIAQRPKESSTHQSNVSISNALENLLKLLNGGINPICSLPDLVKRVAEFIQHHILLAEQQGSDEDDLLAMQPELLLGIFEYIDKKLDMISVNNPMKLLLLKRDLALRFAQLINQFACKNYLTLVQQLIECPFATKMLRHQISHDQLMFNIIVNDADSPYGKTLKVRDVRWLVFDYANTSSIDAKSLAGKYGKATPLLPAEEVAQRMTTRAADDVKADGVKYPQTTI